MQAIETAAEVNEQGHMSTMSDARRGRRLVKGLRWWDGFVLAFAVPVFLFPDLGASAVQLGVIATIALWSLAALAST